MTPLATNLYSAVMSKYGFVMEPLTGPTCLTELQFSVRTYGICTFRVMYITRGSLILADAIVLVLTWIKTFGHWKSARRLSMRVSLTMCLLRDETMFFMRVRLISLIG
ncbi:uncharacterized protein PHACADRAFT_202695 [Phanerochaete carnosa HHB-10118-sp]|uniref:Uncharacterized protein n=1 Tax=Phanerochaete carnosa (strain HHB-10118-sp) TaxID=650164 RepID=K5WEC8_PHACS|nr:uncharacterized protein PHACADRAFT_202695 [Phanerochaete carnosa HHB-10118-sp]EKM48537.1 hypothetical protein PHACADRAFT_202695 [Phanerochaete carnosa HHB-10118-sp]